jgi:medium-chain acyl-[acyl-carrier-protein] hydrolase
MNISESVQTLRIQRRPGSPKIRLVCVPYAGAGASLFYPWRPSLPDDVELVAVQLPARQDRRRENPWTRIGLIVQNIACELAALPHVPTVLLGHSFGAVVAFELARHLSAAKAAPVGLVVAARRAPQLRSPLPPSYRLSDAEFIESIHRRYGRPLSMLQDPDVRALALPPLRADLEALETYVYEPGEPLAIPVMVLRGQTDASVSLEEAIAWRELTRQAPDFREVNGGHFFIDTHRHWVLTQISAMLVEWPALRASSAFPGESAAGR